MQHPHRPKQIIPHFHSEQGHTHVPHRPGEKRRLFWCIVLTGNMMIAEFVGGFITNSLALMSDAQHMFSHLFALSVSYFAIRFAARPETSNKTYGYYRVEILAAFCNGISLIIITCFIVYAALQRFLNPVSVDDHGMLVVAVAGLMVNLVTALLLYRVSREDLNVRSAFLHMAGDTFSSVGVIGAAVAIHYTGKDVIDPVVSVFIAGLILAWSFKLIYDSVHVLMESAPRHLDAYQVSGALKEAFEEIEEIHDVHVWEITSKMYALTAHIVVKDCMVSDTSMLLDKWNVFLDNKFDIEHTTIQIESSCSK